MIAKIPSRVNERGFFRKRPADYLLSGADEPLFGATFVAGC